MVTYNGDSNSLTGQGSPNPIKLTLPMLDQVQDPAVQASLLRIQQFINNLVAPSGGGGGYASLTGTGETTSPGVLTQQGPWVVVTSTADPSTGDGISMVSTGQTVHIANSTGGGLSLTNTTATFGGAATVITSAGTSGTTVTGPYTYIYATSHLYLGTGTTPEVTMGTPGGKLGFFGATPVVQYNVTGSRGGNAALTNLLTALNLLGLIVNSTTT